MLGDRELGFDDYVAILRRRFWSLAVPALVLPVLAYTASLALPDQFTSQTLVLVEQQKVPDNFVKPAVTEQVTERLATMQEQILSRTRLQPLIERFGLYKSSQRNVPMEMLVERMRLSIAVSAVRPDFGSRAGGLPGFFISFTSDDPRVAQQVCAEITSMFMEENLRAREQRAQGTTDFLQSQLDEAKQKLDEQDAKLAEFKKAYIGQLPGQEQMNMSLLMGLNTQLDAATQSLSRAQQDKAYVESLLAQQLSAYRGKGDEGTSTPEALDRQLASLQSQLVTLQSRYTDSHPDVVKIKRDIAGMKQRLEQFAAAPAEAAGKTSKPAANEPNEIKQLRAQLYQYQQAIREKTAQQRSIQGQIGLYQSRVQLSPVDEEQFKGLTRDHQTALDFYTELLAKRTQSEMATDLERRQQGEQFRVIDPANLPERPSFPNRPLFGLGGLGGGLALGLGLVFILELRDKSLRSEQDVTMYLNLPTLAVMPTLGQANGNGHRPNRLRQYISLGRKSRPQDRAEL